MTQHFVPEPCDAAKAGFNNSYNLKAENVNG